MASHGRSDARGTARLLANMALSSIADPRIGASHEVALNNMFRLLQSFRTDIFFGQEAPPNSREVVADKLTLRPPEEQNVRLVKEALEQATARAFGGQSKNEAIEIVERVLRWLAYPKKALEPPEVERTRVSVFFRELVERL